MRPGFDANQFCSFHLTPNSDNIADQHVFRTPSLIAEAENQTMIILPDIETTDTQSVRSYTDIDAVNQVLYYGLSDSITKEHVIYSRVKENIYISGKVELNFYLMLFHEKCANPLRHVLDFYWNRYGSDDFKRRLGSKGDLTLICPRKLYQRKS